MTTRQIIAESAQITGGGRFSDKLNRLLPYVTHRCASTIEEREAVFQVRYQAYKRQNIIHDDSNLRLYDHKYDNSSNSFLTMTSIKGEFASTFRIHVATNAREALPSRAAFSDLIDPYLRAGFTVVDPTRLAARLEMSKHFPELPFLALRPAWLAGVHFDADVVLATVAVDHVPFYQRVFGYETLCEPRDYPMVRFKIVCLGLDFPSVKHAVEERYPFLRSTEAEREELFGVRCVPYALAAKLPPLEPITATSGEAPTATPSLNLKERTTARDLR